jgi:hypothetical protein
MKAACWPISLALFLLVPQSILAFYNPSNGRWLSRDPIEEQGGPNIYAFPLDDPIDQVDYIGQASLSYSSKNKSPGMCGGFTWTIHWKVNKPKPNSSVV